MCCLCYHNELYRTNQHFPKFGPKSWGRIKDMLSSMPILIGDTFAYPLILLSPHPSNPTHHPILHPPIIPSFHHPIPHPPSLIPHPPSPSLYPLINPSCIPPSPISHSPSPIPPSPIPHPPSPIHHPHLSIPSSIHPPSPHLPSLISQPPY